MNSDSPFNKNEIFADEWYTQLAFLISVVSGSWLPEVSGAGS